MWRVSLLAALVAVTGPASALTLEQYFLELSDRERGAYITGFLDFFGRDSARDEEYRACVEELGAAKLHRAVTELVKSDPRLLSHDAMSWILYEASRLCNVKAPSGPPAQPAAEPPAITRPGPPPRSAHSPE